jgi:hypothetical protein
MQNLAYNFPIQSFVLSEDKIEPCNVLKQLANRNM